MGEGIAESRSEVAVHLVGRELFDYLVERGHPRLGQVAVLQQHRPRSMPSSIMDAAMGPWPGREMAFSFLFIFIWANATRSAIGSAPGEDEDRQRHVRCVLEARWQVDAGGSINSAKLQ